ncbi:Gfo/Idh/MocA family oxidoreductase [uncultured Maritimibacter sp.]|jgi:predicted dehydrogenase|uniref:Gfo/Idh/MocA family protein n=1 Tax=uncultured Maritimibacter sp. TaxID=991866 RepID=UPI00260AF19C|nr:Gfo/Idh/MocA family oxidoreductase [uncultured Maritimibacter sp.]
MSAPVKVALAGLGWWGQKITAVLQAAPQDVTIVRAVEPNAEVACAFEAAHGIPVTADLDTALADPEVEAVLLVTPHSLHAAQIAACAKAGKHVSCEKPLAMTRAGAEAAVAAVEGAGLILATGHERRYEPPIAALIEAVDKGEMGRLMQFDATFSHDKFLSLDPTNWRLGADDAPAAGMTATGIHLLDLAVRLMGPAKSVVASCETLASSLPQGDTIAAFITFEGGGTATIAANLAMPFVSRCTLFGSEAWVDIRDRAHVEAPDGWVVTSARKGGKIEVEEVGPAEPVRDNIVAFARAIRGQGSYPITTGQMIDTAALLEAIVASSRTGERVML